MRLEPHPANKNTCTGREYRCSLIVSLLGKTYAKKTAAEDAALTVGCTFPVRLCMFRAVWRSVGIPALQGFPAFTVMTVVSDLHRTSPSSDVLHRNLTARDSIVTKPIAVWIPACQSGQSGVFYAVQCVFDGFFLHDHRLGPVSNRRLPERAATAREKP